MAVTSVRSNGSIVGQVYPNSSLMKTVAQFSALRKGVLDMSFYPISYAGGEFAELNIGLMPGLVSSYKQGAAWKQASVPIGKRESCLLVCRLELLSSSGECCNQRLES